MSGVHGAPPTTPTRGSARLSSGVPSQSSSRPLHNSAVGPTTCTQVRPLGPVPGLGITHSYFALHSPSVKMPAPEQGDWSPLMLLSTVPSQSSSRPLQVSTPRTVAPTQVLAPATHCQVPVVQQSVSAPVDDGQQAIDSHGSVRLSSGVPSQSSSAPLQVSAAGPTVCVQVRPLGPGPALPVQV